MNKFSTRVVCFVALVDYRRPGGVPTLRIRCRDNQLSAVDQLRVERRPLLRHQRPFSTSCPPHFLRRGVAGVSLASPAASFRLGRECDVRRDRADETHSEYRRRR